MGAYIREWACHVSSRHSHKLHRSQAQPSSMGAPTSRVSMDLASLQPTIFRPLSPGHSFLSLHRSRLPFSLPTCLPSASLHAHNSFTPPLGNPGHGAPLSTSPSAFSTSPSSATTSPVSAVRRAEEIIEMSIFNCRFFTLMGIAGSLAGSILCFLKGCFYVAESFREYYLSCWNSVGTGKVILLLVEAVDVYLMGTVMLIFGMGLYELFVSSLDVPGGDCFSSSKRTTVCGSNLFGLFSLRERPKWLEIRSLDELKTKLGHVIVMILLVGMFEKSKKVPINTGLDLLCFSASILFSSGCLFFLSKLHPTK